MRTLVLDVQPGEFALARLHATASLPTELLEPGTSGSLVSATRTPEGLSLVCPVDLVPAGAEAEGGWRVLSVRGPMPFTLTGIVATLASELAAAGVALFSLSTFDTDHVLIQQSDLDRAVDALRTAGHEVALERTS